MVVRMRRNRSQTRQRRSHHAIVGGQRATCACGALRLSHRACPQCGKYNGRIVVDVVARAKRQTARTKRKQKELRESGKATAEKENEAGAKAAK